MDLSRELARSIVETDYSNIPVTTRKRAIDSILDTIGVMVPPSSLDQTCRRLSELVLTEGGNGKSSLLGLGTKCSSVMAAYLNGCFAHVLDYDDIIDEIAHHPSAQTIPAALAVAQKNEKISGPQFITSIVVGSDLGARLSSAPNGQLGKDHQWFPISNFGVFSATAAAGKILALDEEQMLNALGLALHRCHGQLGAITAPESELRAIRDGFINKEGVLCALMAAQGVQTCSDPIERFFNDYYANNYDADRLMDGLGKHFRSSEVSLKPWPCCRLTHGYIEATGDIIRKNALSLAKISKILFEVSEGTRDSFCEPQDIKKAPKLSIQAKFSLFFPVALSLIKKPEISDFLEENLSRPEVLQITDKMEYRINKKLGYQAAISPAIVEIQTVDGKLFNKRIDTVYGHPDNPLSRLDLIHKFKDCMKYSRNKISDSNVNDLAETILHLDEKSDLSSLSILLP